MREKDLKSHNTERIRFYVIIILNMLPAVLFKFFPTMDGPAHLYNSNLLNELLFRPHTSIGDYYALNPILVPNLLSHLILSLINLFFPAFWAEKVLIVSYLFLLPASFRSLTKFYNKTSLSYLIFPFCYSGLFYLGFYNLSMSFILLFYTLLFWKKNENRLHIKSLFFLFLLVTATYFAHIFTFIFLVSTLLFDIFLSWCSGIMHKKNNIRLYIRKFLFVVMATVPAMFLLFVFMSNTSFEASQKTLPTSELIKWIKDVRPLIALGYEQELRFTEIYYHLLIALSTIIFFVKVQDYKSKYQKSILSSTLFKQLNYSKILYLFMSITTLFLYFIVPNSSSAGMMSDRLCLMFFLYAIVWIAIANYPLWLRNVSMIAILYVNFGLVLRYIKATNGLNDTAIAINEASHKIKSYATVLPINNSNEWLQPHFSNYLGIDKPLIILENYEASVGWFAVKWNESDFPILKFGDLYNTDCSYAWRSGKKNIEKKIDYIFVWGKDKEISHAANEQLQKYYKLIYSSSDEKTKLYELNIQ
jgi:hypothetical protein